MSVRINQETGLVAVKSLGLAGGNTRVNQEFLMLITPVVLQGSKVQIIGGPFQDPLGNPLSNGFLLMQLQHDAVALGTGQIIGNVAVRVPLDANGFIQGTVTGNPVFIWPTNVLLPSGTLYTVWAYDASNKLAWDNPQIQPVNSVPSPFNVNAWIPGP